MCAVLGQPLVEEDTVKRGPRIGRVGYSKERTKDTVKRGPRIQ